MFYTEATSSTLSSPIRSVLPAKASAIMSCEASYKRGLKKRVVTLGDCIKTLKQSICEAEAAQTDMTKARWGLAVAQSAKLAADIFILEIASYLVAKKNPAGEELIKFVYSGMIAGATAVGNKMAGVKKTSVTKDYVKNRFIDAHVTATDTVIEHSTQIPAKLSKYFKKASKLLNKIGLDKEFSKSPIGTTLSLYNYSKAALDIAQEFYSDPGSGIAASKRGNIKMMRKFVSKLQQIEVELGKCA